MSAYKRQRQKILDLLIAARGAWVSLPDILSLGVAQYNARVYELRRLGFRIENKTERDAAGQVHSWFRLTGGREQTTSKDSDYAKRTRELEAAAVPLFAGASDNHAFDLAGPIFGQVVQ